MFILVASLVSASAGEPTMVERSAKQLDRVATSSSALASTTECILTYRITRGNSQDEGVARGSNMRIRDTFWGLGNGTYSLGPGELTLRVTSDGASRPAAGKVEILNYRLVMNFTAGSAATVTNRMLATAHHPKDPTRAVATGHLRMGRRPVVTWLPCILPPGSNEDEDSYTPDVIGYGPGCLAPYLSQGNVNCDGVLCGAGNLEDGDNPQVDIWEQALQPMQLTPDLKGFWMDFMLVPNRMPSRTFVNLEGRLVSSQCK